MFVSLAPGAHYELLELRQRWHIDKVASEKRKCSRSSHLCGWITALCNWDLHGKLINSSHTEDACNIDGAKFLRIEHDEIPPGSAPFPTNVKTRWERVL
jgi:hypothetical protein